uniref:hypothetical protein n=1 Tax=Providencia alcalifaciens TaxID=126385 RepID=UPI002B053F73
LERLTSFIIAIVIFATFALILSEKHFSINMPVILLIYVIAATNAVLQTYNRGGKVNRILSAILATVLTAGFVMGLYVAI